MEPVRTELAPHHDKSTDGDAVRDNNDVSNGLFSEPVTSFWVTISLNLAKDLIHTTADVEARLPEREAAPVLPLVLSDLLDPFPFIWVLLGCLLEPGAFKETPVLLHQQRTLFH